MNTTTIYQHRANMREAIIKKFNGMYVVELYLNNALVETRELPGKSIYYAEDVKENWENGLIKL